MSGTKGKSGGYREGAGRKKLPDSDKVKKVNIKISTELKKLLDNLEGENYDERINNLSNILSNIVLEKSNIE